ncbi:MAG: ABC transporter permease [Candidatus Ancillula sp.]|jgi:ABC-2 type transport system permease protein|nr:ABC transporter permease [Candidatus Ancillula sp.]
MNAYVAGQNLKRHSSIKETLKQIFAFAWRSILKIRREPEQLVDVLIQPIIFTLIFVYIFGGAIAGNIANYLPYVIPGVLAQSSVTASLTTGVVIREDQEKGVFYRFRSLPIARVAPLAGAAIADIIRYLTIGIVTMLMGFIMGMRPGGGVLGAIGCIFLAVFISWCISWIFSLLAQVLKTAQSMQGIGMVILFPLTFISNAFVSTDTLPSALKWFANINPVSHLVTAMRELLNNGVVGHQFFLTLLTGVLCVMIFAPTTVYAYIKRG